MCVHQGNSLGVSTTNQKCVASSRSVALQLFCYLYKTSKELREGQYAQMCVVVTLCSYAAHLKHKTTKIYKTFFTKLFFNENKLFLSLYSVKTCVVSKTCRQCMKLKICMHKAMDNRGAHPKNLSAIFIID